jgi:hypothetical protein
VANLGKFLDVLRDHGCFDRPHNYRPSECGVQLREESPLLREDKGNCDLRTNKHAGPGPVSSSLTFLFGFS